MLKSAGVLFLLVFLAVGCSDGEIQASGDNSPTLQSESADDIDAGDAADGDDSAAGNNSADDDADSARLDGADGGPSAEAARNAESGFNESIETTSDIKARQAVAIQRVETNGDELTVYFEMESQECYGVDVETSETDTQVEISLWTGLLAAANAQSCGVGVYPYQTTVNLKGPVGDRTLVAGDDSEVSVPSGPQSIDDSFEPREVDVDELGNPEPAQFVGLDIEVAIDLAEGNGIAWRVVKLDGEARDDGSSGAGRLSFEVGDNRVVTATWG